MWEINDAKLVHYTEWPSNLRTWKKWQALLLVHDVVAYVGNGLIQNDVASEHKLTGNIVTSDFLLKPNHVRNSFNDK